MTHTRFILTVAGAMAALTLSATAQRGPGGPPPGRPPGPPPQGAPTGADTAKKEVRPGDLSELTALKDKFMAFQRLQFGGEAYFASRDGELLGRYGRLYQTIQQTVTGDRLDEPNGRQFVESLIAIGRKAKELRGSDDALASEDAVIIAGDLANLEDNLAKTAIKQVDPATFSPELNRVQWIMDELIRYGKTGAISETRVTGLIRKTEGLEKKEDEAKADGKLNDREREGLLAGSRGVWKAFVEAFS